MQARSFGRPHCLFACQPEPWLHLSMCFPHPPLFLHSNLEMGLGRRPFKSGGDVGRGAHSGAFFRCCAQLLTLACVLLPLPGWHCCRCCCRQYCRCCCRCCCRRRCHHRCSLCSAPPPAAGANVTFWNLHFAGGRGRPWLPDCDFGPMQNFVGLYQPPEELDPPLPWDQPIARFPRW